MEPQSQQQPQQQPNTQPGSTPPDYWQSGGNTPKPNKGRKLLWIVIGLSAVLLVIVISVMLLPDGDNGTSQQGQETQTSEDIGIDPANPVSIEQINNSITQDISSLNEETDFTSNRLSDQALGL